MSTNTKKWNEETVAQLMSIIGNESPVSGDTVEKAAAAIGVTVRSIASKLRQLDIVVASMAKERIASFSDVEGDSLRAFVGNNTGTMTYADIAAAFANGKFTAKQIQGKILAMELTGSVKPTEKVEVARTYSEQEEAKFIAMVNKGSFIEDIAETLGKTVASVRGKALSLSRSGAIAAIPKQKESHAKDQVDAIEALGASIAEMTVAEIATKTDKTERGIKTTLTRRGIKVKDYDGAAKKAKATEKNNA